MWVYIGGSCLPRAQRRGPEGDPAPLSDGTARKKFPLPNQVASAGLWSRELLETAVAGSG